MIVRHKLVALTDKIQAAFAMFESITGSMHFISRSWTRMYCKLIPCWALRVLGGQYRHLTGPAGVGLDEFTIFSLNEQYPGA
jgi:hypothetical protein